MTATITTESLLASINETVLAVEQAQERLVAQTEEIAAHKVAGATASAKGHVKLKDTAGDEDAAEGATALTPKALKDFNTANSGVIINVRDMLRAEIEAISGGRNTIIRDSNGNPHVMVVIPKFRMQDIDESLGTGVHPAFIVDGVEKPEFFIGKYAASKGVGNVPLTIPRRPIYSNIFVTGAIEKCRALGPGFCCVTNAMWSARALYLWKYFGGAEGDHVYHGNASGGLSNDKAFLTGTLANPALELGDGGLTLTGTGPVEWNDDNTPWGISDLSGNAVQYVSGLRAVAGELQVIPNNDAALSTCDMSDQSTAWKAILEDGSLVTPGTSGTLKYTHPSGEDISLTDGTSECLTSKNHTFKTLGAGNLTVPGILKTLGLFPIADNVQGQLYFGGSGFNGAVYPVRGGALRLGPFSLCFYVSKTANDITFRVGYVA